MVEGKWKIRRKDKNKVIQRTDSGMVEGRGMMEDRELMDGMTTSIETDTGENVNAIILRTDFRRRNDAPLPRAEEDKHPPHPPTTVRTHKNPFEAVREQERQITTEQNKARKNPSLATEEKGRPQLKIKQGSITRFVMKRDRQKAENEKNHHVPQLLSNIFPKRRYNHPLRRTL